MKVTMEMNQVLIEQVDLLYKYLEQFFRALFSWIHLLCYRWIVYSWLRSTVTDGGCQYQHSWLRGTARCEHQWQHDHFHRLPQWLSMSAHCLVLSCLLHRHAHTHRGSSVESVTPSTWSSLCERFSSPWLSLSISCSSSRTFSSSSTHLKFVENLHTSPNESMDSTDEFTLSTSTVGRRFPIGNVSLYTVKKDYSYLCMWMTQNWLERNKILIRCGNYSTKKSIWETQHLSWIMYTWDVLKDNVK